MAILMIERWVFPSSKQVNNVKGIGVLRCNSLQMNRTTTSSDKSSHTKTVAIFSTNSAKNWQGLAE
jgi:hypothetical protein